MIRVDGNILLDFGFVDALKNCQAVPDARDAHLFQFVMFQGYQRFSHNFILCTVSREDHVRLNSKQQARGGR